MSNILQVLTNRGAFFLFAALEMYCLYLVINYNSQQRIVADASWNYYGGIVMERMDNLRNYLVLDKENEKLRAENAALLARLPSAFYTETVTVDSIQDDSLRQRYTYLATEIINKSPLSANITYVINRGHIHGVEAHQGVVNENGIIGIVTKVSPRHALVMSLLHRDMRLSAGLRNKFFFGTLAWEGGDTRIATLSAIPDYASVAIGDTVETTGYSSIFPKGIAIGTVKARRTVSGGSNVLLDVKLFNDFYRLKHGYVVRDLMKDDIEQLETPPEQ